MPLYTFYPCQPDGTSRTFVTHELDDDREAQRRALEVGRQHASCCYVAVWCGGRQVAEVVGGPGPSSSRWASAGDRAQC